MSACIRLSRCYNTVFFIFILFPPSPICIEESHFDLVVSVKEMPTKQFFLTVLRGEKNNQYLSHGSMQSI